MTNGIEAWVVRVLDDVVAELERRSLACAKVDDHVLLPFEHRDGRRFGVVFTTGPTVEHGLFAKAAPAAPVAREHWPALLFALDNWNATTVGPKAHLHAEDWVGDETATVYLEAWLPVPSDGAVDGEQLRAVVDALLRACALFVLPDLVADGQG
jgi:hypothetical protein